MQIKPNPPSPKGKPAPPTAFTNAKLENAFRQLSVDADYSLQTGIKLINMNVRNIKGMKLGSDENTNPDLLWHLAKLMHTTNYNAVDKLIRNMQQNNVTPDSWRTISDYARANQKEVSTMMRSDVAFWLKNVNDVFTNGPALVAP